MSHSVRWFHAIGVRCRHCTSDILEYRRRCTIRKNQDFFADVTSILKPTYFDVAVSPRTLACGVLALLINSEINSFNTMSSELATHVSAFIGTSIVLYLATSPRKVSRQELEENRFSRIQHITRHISGTHRQQMCTTTETLASCDSSAHSGGSQASGWMDRTFEAITPWCSRMREKNLL